MALVSAPDIVFIGHEMKEIQSALQEFLNDFPEYDHHELEKLREDEYQRLDQQGHAYLDYTGGGLYGESQLTDHFNMLRDTVAGNPHSRNPTSHAMTVRVENARAAIFDYFHADPNEYLAIFTPNASGALKHIGECYPFSTDSELLLTFDNHNSVNGIREFAKTKGAKVNYVPLCKEELRIKPQDVDEKLNSPLPPADHLFAYCAQSNFSGVKHPLSWVQKAQDLGWDVLLDAAAFVPTNQLDLSVHKPNFVALSFYKMFGYPTGLGCLLVRRDTVNKLCRPWFAGGTVSVASVQGESHYLSENEAAFEDGTVNYLSIPAIQNGLKHIREVGIDAIQRRTSALTQWLLDQLSSMQHGNGSPVIEIFGPKTTQDRGATIALAVRDPEGAAFDERRIEYLAGKEGISLRTGCFCNPGAGEVAHDLNAGEMQALFETGKTVSFDQLRETIQNDYQKSVASLRVSLGIASNFADIYRLMEFLEQFVDCAATAIGVNPPEEHVSLRDAT